MERILRLANGLREEGVALIRVGRATDAAVVTWCNAPFLRLTGLSDGGVTGVAVADLIQPGVWVDPVAVAVAIGEAAAKLRQPDGAPVRLVRLSDPGAEEGLLALTCTAHPSGLVQEKAAAPQIESLMAYGLVAADDIVILDAGGVAVWANARFLDRHGLHLDSVKGRRQPEFLSLSPAEQTQFSARLRRVLSGVPERIECLVLQDASGGGWSDFQLTPIRAQEDRITHVLISGRDITDRKHVEEMLRAEAARAGSADVRLRQAIEAIPDAFVLYDSDDRVVMFNSAYSQIYREIGFLEPLQHGITFAEILRAGLASNLYPDAVGREEAWLEERLAEHRNPSGWRERTLPGDRYLRMMERRTGNGDIIGMRIDVTELRREQNRIEAERAEHERLSAVVRHISDHAVVQEPDGRIIWANAAFLRSVGLNLEEVKGRRPSDFLSGFNYDPEIMKAALRKLAETGTASAVVSHAHAEGGESILEVQLENIYDERGSVTAIVSLGRDIRQRREAEHAIEAEKHRAEAAEQRLWAAIDAIPDAFVLYDAEDRLVLHNETYRKLYAESANAIEIGATFESILRAGLAEGQYAEALGREEEWLAQRLADHRNPTGSVEQKLPGDRYLKVLERKTASGDTVGFRVDITDLKRQQNRLERYAELLQKANDEIEKKHAELMQTQLAVEHAAMHDALTGLANRRHLDAMLNGISATRSDSGVALLHIDLDRFKQINDTLGHAAGDAVLVEVAKILRRTTRATDLVARVGGDEFVVLCQERIERSDLAAMADRIVTSMRKPVEFEGHKCRFGASVGIAIAPPGMVKAHELLVNADIALYRAKNMGRNCHEFFSDELQVELSRRKRIADDIVVGLDRGEFIPYFQPQFDLETLAVIGVEALARWRRPDGSVQGPGQFLDIARDLTLDATIDRVILEQALEAIRGWDADGLGIPKVSVNVSARRLGDPGLIESVRNLHIPSGKVVFELLESIYLDETEGVVAWNLDMLRDLGIAVELDDFGSGYASILSLVQIQPSAIKIDQKLVRPIDGSDTALKLVESLINIGRSLNVTVIAEGVETARQAQLLRSMGCDAAQGNHFSVPLPEEELRRFVIGQHWRSAG